MLQCKTGKGQFDQQQRDQRCPTPATAAPHQRQPDHQTANDQPRQQSNEPRPTLQSQQAGRADHHQHQRNPLPPTEPRTAHLAAG